MQETIKNTEHHYKYILKPINPKRNAYGRLAFGRWQYVNPSKQSEGYCKYIVTVETAWGEAMLYGRNGWNIYYPPGDLPPDIVREVFNRLTDVATEIEMRLREANNV